MKVCLKIFLALILTLSSCRTIKKYEKIELLYAIKSVDGCFKPSSVIILEDDSTISFPTDELFEKMSINEMKRNYNKGYYYENFDTPKGIIGTDDRKEYFELSTTEKQWAPITAAFIHKSKIIKSSKPGFSIIKGATLTNRDICECEKYSNQPTAVTCSGIAVNDSTVISAGHCFGTNRVYDPKKLADHKVVFGFWKDSLAQTSYEVSNERIYEVKSKPDEIHCFSHSTDQDYICIELKNKISHHSQGYPKVRIPIAIEKIYALGYPGGREIAGIPLKAATNGKIQSVDPSLGNYKADLDLFRKNSGSPVFSVSDNSLVGIVTRVTGGDYTPMTGANCRIALVRRKGSQTVQKINFKY